ncbi:MAG: glycosyltransferase [Candidatus Contendobacter sp.]|nr:glycosyltransferase [Candidatus Contendobacter sp.]MDG4558128.1 glycosyltransferase [Candidatus Contendobacter sp.]
MMKSHQKTPDLNNRASLLQIARWVRPASSVLDIGCGPGILGRYLTEILNCRVDGIENNSAAAQLATPCYRHLIVADLEQAVLTDLFPGELYDYIIFADVLEHLRNPGHIINQALKSLAPNGRFLLSVPNVAYAGLVAELLAGEFRYRPLGLLDETHLRFFTRKSLDRWLSAHGLAVCRWENIVVDIAFSEFEHCLDDLPSALKDALLVRPDALVYQFIVEAQVASNTSVLAVNNSSEFSLSVVFSTRNVDFGFIDHVRNTIGIPDVEIIPYANQSEFSLAELYNRGLKESKHDIVVFIHDDVIFNRNNWGQVILKQFRDTDYGVLGVAGTTDLIKDSDGIAQPWWIMANRMVGRLRHEINGKVIDSFYSNRYDHPIQVVCLDGVFIAAHKGRIRKLFDERFKGFHYYDVSFTFANHLAGAKIGVIFDIDLTHKSVGNLKIEWQESQLLFSELYGNQLPFRLKASKVEYDNLTVIKFNPGNAFISVIIPTKNKTDLVLDCIRSIIENTHVAQYEILIADTGSTDENKKILADRIREIDRSKNLNGIRVIDYNYYNFAKINNDVVKNHLMKKSNYIIFCNNDIKLLNDAIDRCLRLFKERKHIGTVGIRLHYGDNSIQHNGLEISFGLGKIVSFTHRNLNSYYRYDQDVIEVAGNTAAFLMIERSIFQKFYFNENYKECFEDVELNLRILKAGRKNYNIGQAVAYHYESQTRKEDSNFANKIEEDYQNNLLPFFKKHCVALFFAQLFEGALRASREGRYQTALEIGELLLEHAPRHPDIHHLVGVIHGRWGDQAGAVKHIRQAIALNGQIPFYHYNLAEALRRQEDWKQAEQSYRHALRLAPGMVDAHVNLANLLKDQGRHDEALAHYQHALGLNPNQALVYCCMGDILRQRGIYDAAMECYQHAIQLQPDLADAYHHLGMVLSHMENRLDEAAQCYRQVLRYRPDSTEARINLGKMLEQQGLIEEARECYQQVPAMGAGHALFLLHVESLCPPVPASNAAIDDYRAALGARLEQWRGLPDPQLDLGSLHASDLEPPLALIYQGRDDRPLKEAWATLFQNLLPAVESLPLASGRPHVGFVVTRRHEEAFLKGMAGILNHLSAGHFDLTVVCSQQGGEERLRVGIRNPAVRYLPLPDRLDHGVERLRQARFTVLYHWEVGTDSINYFLPFFRLAPVQCTGWGWPVTSGIPEMNYYLSAQHLETADGDAHYSERLVRFRRLPVYFHRPELPTGPVERERFGFAAGQHLYVCTQNPRKIHPDFDELLAGVLRRDPGGVVALVEDIQPAVTAALRQRLQTRLPDIIDRVRFLPWLAYQDYLGLLVAADVALDTLHFGGGMTTYDALAVGLPVVTLPGAFSRGRHVHAAYRQMGLDEGIAANPADYVERAVRFASEPDYRAAFGARLREASAELFEDRQAIREFEDFLQAAAAGLSVR